MPRGFPSADKGFIVPRRDIPVPPEVGDGLPLEDIWEPVIELPNGELAVASLPVETDALMLPVVPLEEPPAWGDPVAAWVW